MSDREKANDGSTTSSKDSYKRHGESQELDARKDLRPESTNLESAHLFKDQALMTERIDCYLVDDGRPPA